MPIITCNPALFECSPSRLSIRTVLENLWIFPNEPPCNINLLEGISYNPLYTISTMHFWIKQQSPTHRGIVYISDGSTFHKDTPELPTHLSFSHPLNICVPEEFIVEIELPICHFAIQLYLYDMR